MTKEEMDAMFRESAEAMNRGISVDEFRAEKLGIDPDILDFIEGVEPDLKKMSSENIKKYLYDWFFKLFKNIDTQSSFTIAQLANAFVQKIITLKDKKLNSLMPGFALLKAATVGGKLDISINSLDISGEQIAESEYVQNYLKNHPHTDAIVLKGIDLGIYFPNYPERLFLGHIRIHPDGVLYRKNGNFYFKGDIVGLDDVYDFNLTNAEGEVFRNESDQNWTEIGNELNKKFHFKKFKIKFKGKKHINELKNMK
ncbi:MAG: hypothetical protein ACOY3I_04705 [Verrucomicrobiota bacterium]